MNYKLKKKWHLKALETKKKINRNSRKNNKTIGTLGIERHQKLLIEGLISTMNRTSLSETGHKIDQLVKQEAIKLTHQENY